MLLAVLIANHNSEAQAYKYNPKTSTQVNDIRAVNYLDSGGWYFGAFINPQPGIWYKLDLEDLATHSFREAKRAKNIIILIGKHDNQRYILDMDILERVITRASRGDNRAVRRLQSVQTLAFRLLDVSLSITAIKSILGFLCIAPA